METWAWWRFELFTLVMLLDILHVRLLGHYGKGETSGARLIPHASERAEERGSPTTIYGQFQQRILNLCSMGASGDENENGAPDFKILTTCLTFNAGIWLCTLCDIVDSIHTEIKLFI